MARKITSEIRDNQNQGQMKGNAIKALVPYRWNKLWVFDDEEVGLRREAFVCGADDMAEFLFQQAGGPVKGQPDQFILLFSETPIPGAQLELQHVKGSRERGNTYREVKTGAEGWLCPAMYHYFTNAPVRIYAKGIPFSRPRVRSGLANKTKTQNTK